MDLYFFLNVGRWQIQAGSGILAAWVEFERKAPTCTNSSRTSCSNGLLSPTVTTEAKCILEAMLFCLCSLQAEPLQQFFEKPGEEPQPPQACQIWKRSLGCCSWHFRVDQRAHGTTLDPGHDSHNDMRGDSLSNVCFVEWFHKKFESWRIVTKMTSHPCKYLGRYIVVIEHLVA